MKKKFFKTLALINRKLLPSLSKKRVDLSRATKAQKALLAYRYYITTQSLD
ncbi:MAG: SsrA-binding protein [Bacteroidetes bacterium]|jgi:hypothetical protein|nr:SsrA-binding protein [Bacteroidota bacterium]